MGRISVCSSSIVQSAIYLASNGSTLVILDSWWKRHESKKVWKRRWRCWKWEDRYRTVDLWLTPTIPCDANVSFFHLLPLMLANARVRECGELPLTTMDKCGYIYLERTPMILGSMHQLSSNVATAISFNNQFQSSKYCCSSWIVFIRIQFEWIVWPRCSYTHSSNHSKTLSCHKLNASWKLAGLCLRSGKNRLLLPSWNHAIPTGDIKSALHTTPLVAAMDIAMCVWINVFIFKLDQCIIFPPWFYGWHHIIILSTIIQNNIFFDWSWVDMLDELSLEWRVFKVSPVNTIKRFLSLNRGFDSNTTDLKTNSYKARSDDLLLKASALTT